MLHFPLFHLIFQSRSLFSELLKLPILPDVSFPRSFMEAKKNNTYMKELPQCRGNQDDRAPHASPIRTHRSPQVAPYPENGRHHAGIQIATNNPHLDP